MCGIAGFLSASDTLPVQEARARLNAMTDALSHRGPDGDGHWHDDGAGVFLGHRRLSILDLSPAGAQPMHSHCGRYVMVYNGEVYNAPEMLKRLQTTHPDIVMKGHSDSEVLLESFARLGTNETLANIKGMFAIALWDRREKTLLLARDHIGKKPLYVGWVDGHIAFASELKALRKLCAQSLDIDRAALQSYKYFGFIPAPKSIYEGIIKLPPAHYMNIDMNDVKSKDAALILRKMQSYWQLQKSQPTGDSLKDILSTAVKQRMASDVPLGAFLSGGIDSSLVTAMMQEHADKPVKSYSIGFEDTAFDESRYAEKIAAHLGTDHKTYMVASGESQNIIPDLPRIYDEPFADYSQIPTAILCQHARKDTTVALSGDGGDEMFAGYKRYFMLQKLLNATQPIPNPLRAALSTLIKALPQSAYNALRLNGKRMHSIAGFMGEGGFDEATLRTLSMNTDAALPDLNLALDDDLTGIERMMMIDCLLYLPDDILVKVDRASMFSSLEVRSPLLDKDVIEYAWSLPIENKTFPDKTRGKKPLYDLLCSYVPQELVDRPKQGFTPPIASWLRGELKDWAGDMLALDSGLYEQAYVRRLWDEFLSGHADYHNALWSILMAQSWYKFNIE